MNRRSNDTGSPSSAIKRELADYEVLTLAVYLLGGERRPVDTEDVAKKANEVAPGRFTWRKYKDQINLEIVRRSLSRAKKDVKGEYLIGTGNSGWSLSEAGLAFAREHAGAVKALEAAEPRKNVGRDRQRHQRERARLLGTEAYAKIAGDRAQDLTQRDAESFFRIDTYVHGEARRRRIAMIANAHGDDPELGPVIEHLAEMTKENNDGN